MVVTAGVDAILGGARARLEGPSPPGEGGAACVVAIMGTTDPALSEEGSGVDAIVGGPLPCGLEPVGGCELDGPAWADRTGSRMMMGGGAESCRYGLYARAGGRGIGCEDVVLV